MLSLLLAALLSQDAAPLPPPPADRPAPATDDVTVSPDAAAPAVPPPDPPPPQDAPQEDVPRRKQPPTVTPHAEETNPQDLAPAALGGLKPELTAAAVGSLVPLVAWLPALGMGMVAWLMIASVLPLSRFDPTSQGASETEPRFWTSMCCYGCLTGIGAWMLAFPSAVVGGVLASFIGPLAGVTVGTVGNPGQWLRSAAAAAAGVGAGLLATVVSVALVAASGAAFVAASYGLALAFTSYTGGTGPGPRLRPAFIGTASAFVGISSAVLTAGVVAALLPAGSALLAYVGVRRSLQALLPTEN